MCSSLMVALGLLTLALPVIAAPPSSPAAAKTEKKMEAPVNIPMETDALRVPAFPAHGDCLIRNGTLLTVTHGTLKNADLLILHGKIRAIGIHLTAPAGVPILDATGKFVTPGLIDAHSHVASLETNEYTDVVTAEVNMADVIEPRSLSLYRGLSSGVTSSLILHGSSNAIGGQSVVVKMKWNRPVAELFVPDAPRMIKFALGENPKDYNADRGRYPRTRLGVESVYRRAFLDARRYRKLWDDYAKIKLAEPDASPPRRDLRLETLADILQGKIRVQCHSYRADEMLMMLRLSREFGFMLVLQHALEAYKIAPEIAAAHAMVSTFAADWAYKIEVIDAIPYNAALCTHAGIVTSVNSDNSSGTYHLNIEAARCMKYGRLDEAQALKLITLNPAIQLGIERRAGSLEVGKDGDLAIWQGHPLSVYSKCVMTFIEGETYFQRRDAYGVDTTATIHDALPLCLVDPQSLPLPRAANVYAIVGGTIHPISGPDIPGGTLVLENGRIKAVGIHITPPRGAVVVNARGLQVYPGLIDAGSPLGLTEIGAVRATDDTREAGLFQPDLTALTAVNPSSDHFAVTRYSGITTTQTSPSGDLIAGQGALIDLAGWTPDEMAVKPITALHLSFPEPMTEETAAFLRTFLPDTAIEQRKKDYETRLKQLTDYFAEAKRYEAAREKEPNGLPSDLRLEAMRPYVTGKRPVILHVSSARAIRKAVKFAEANGLQPVIAGGQYAWRVADLLAKKRIPVIFSMPLSDSMEYDYDLDNFTPYDTAFAAPALLARAGVKFCFQSGDAAAARNLPAQVGMACAFGLSHDAALTALTLHAAEILGAADQVGSLEPGKLGNVIVTDGDPLEVQTDLHYLFIKGHPAPLESRHTRLYLRYRQRIGPTPAYLGKHVNSPGT